MAGSPGRVPGASVKAPWAAGAVVGVPSESVKAPYVVGGSSFEAGRSEVVEPRRAGRGDGDGRSGGGAEAADALNPLRVAKR